LIAAKPDVIVAVAPQPARAAKLPYVFCGDIKGM